MLIHEKAADVILHPFHRHKVSYHRCFHVDQAVEWWDVGHTNKTLSEDREVCAAAAYYSVLYEDGMSLLNFRSSTETRRARGCHQSDWLIVFNNTHPHMRSHLLVFNMGNGGTQQCGSVYLLTWKKGGNHYLWQKKAAQGRRNLTSMFVPNEHCVHKTFIYIGYLINPYYFYMWWTYQTF